VEFRIAETDITYLKKKLIEDFKNATPEEQYRITEELMSLRKDEAIVPSVIQSLIKSSDQKFESLIETNLESNYRSRIDVNLVHWAISYLQIT